MPSYRWSYGMLWHLIWEWSEAYPHKLVAALGRMVLIFVISSVFEVLAGIINESFYCFWKCDKNSFLYDGSDVVELMRSAYIKELLWSFLCNLICMTPDLGVVFLMFVLITGISLRALGGVDLAQFLTRVWGCEGRSCVCCRHWSGLVSQEKSIWLTMLSVLAPRLNLVGRECLWSYKKRRRHRQSLSSGWTRRVAYIVHNFSGTLSHFH